MAVRRTVTMKDVAAEVGVSVAAVSAALAGQYKTIYVSEETRQRVREAARRMGYRPHAVARSLRRRHTDVIGFYCGYGYLNTTRPFFAEVIGGLQQGCDAHRKDLLLHGAFPERPVEDVYAQLMDGSTDGLVVFAPQEDPLAALLAASDLPVMAIVDAVPGLASVVVDDATGGRKLVDHLVQRGHRRLLYWRASGSTTSPDRRRNAFCEAAGARGLVVREYAQASYTESAEDVLATWFEAPAAERETAVACWHDMAAYRLLAQCRTHGIEVPQDLAITGYDGMQSPFGTAWRLTTVRAPWLEVARTAVSLLVGQIDGQAPPPETVLPVEFVAGDTA